MMEEDRKKIGSSYDDIIDLPRHVSVRHPRMPLQDRAAQFSAFAALTGHEAAILETARLTDAFVELDEDRKMQIDGQLWLIRENLGQRPEITVTYFKPSNFLNQLKKERRNLCDGLRESEKNRRVWTADPFYGWNSPPGGSYFFHRRRDVP